MTDPDSKTKERKLNNWESINKTRTVWSGTNGSAYLSTWWFCSEGGAKEWGELRVSCLEKIFKAWFLKNW